MAPSSNALPPLVPSGSTGRTSADFSAAVGPSSRPAQNGTAARKDGNALAAERMKVGGNVLLDTLVNADGTAQSFTAAGAIYLVDADIGGFLGCSGAQLGANKDGDGLVASRMKVANLALDTWVNAADGAVQSFTAAGAVWLDGADIGGFLSCSGAQLKAGPDGTAARKDGNALAAERMKVGGNVLLDTLVNADGTAQSFTAAGAIYLVDADIGGFLGCSGAQLRANKDGDGLVASRMKVGNIALDTWVNADGAVQQRFTAAGTVRLDGADIGGSLGCTGAQLTAANKDGNALAAYQMKVGGDVLLDTWVNADGTAQSFTAAGAVQLVDADIGGGLSCTGAQLAACRYRHGGQQGRRRASGQPDEGRQDRAGHLGQGGWHRPAALHRRWRRPA